MAPFPSSLWRSKVNTAGSVAAASMPAYAMQQALDRPVPNASPFSFVEHLSEQNAILTERITVLQGAHQVVLAELRALRAALPPIAQQPSLMDNLDPAASVGGAASISGAVMPARALHHGKQSIGLLTR